MNNTMKALTAGIAAVIASAAMISTASAATYIDRHGNIYYDNSNDCAVYSIFRIPVRCSRSYTPGAKRSISQHIRLICRMSRSFRGKAGQKKAPEGEPPGYINHNEGRRESM